jgi:hypothetical protein
MEKVMKSILLAMIVMGFIIFKQNADANTKIPLHLQAIPTAYYDTTDYTTYTKSSMVYKNYDECITKHLHQRGLCFFYTSDKEVIKIHKNN